MPINASPFFERAQADYENAQTTDQKIICLKKMIVLAPKHKSSENLLANLKTRLKKLKYSKEKEDKSGKSSFKGIKKEDMQAIIIGKTNTGKSSLLKMLTNAEPKISEFKFTTTHPVIGMMNFATTSIQLIENPAIDSDYYNKGLTHTADTLLLLITDLEQIKEIEPFLKKAPLKKLLIYNSIKTEDLRKLRATLKSKYKKYNSIIISTKTKENIDELKNKIFQSFDKIRVYTKQPNKKQKETRPIILKPNSTIEDVAEKILHGFSKKVKQTKIWGPSSKFSGQKVGLKHKLKDMDVVEFKTG